MNILVLNQDWFVEEWRASGHKAYSCGLPAHLDVSLPAPQMHIDKVLELFPEKFSPDIIVIHDNSGPIVVSGLEEKEIPVIFYSVDTHHHHALHKYLAQWFDYTLVAQSDYIPEFNRVGATAEWMPLWASRYMDASSEKRHGAVFVGNLDPKLNPGRVKFFEQLKKEVAVETTIGKYWEIFPYSEIVVNQTVKLDLNFRVFEAMMSGAMLLTERSGNGLSELFKDNEHLVLYTKDDVKDAASKIAYYLEHKDKARAIGLKGREEILRNHTSQARAARFEEIFRDLKISGRRRKFFGAAANYCDLGFRSEKIDTTVTVKAYISSLQCLDRALAAGEPIDTQLACYAVCAALNYDRFLKTGAGHELLFKLREAYPDEAVLNIAVLRKYLNDGKFELARQLAEVISCEPYSDTFSRSEDIITMILSGQSFTM